MSSISDAKFDHSHAPQRPSCAAERHVPPEVVTPNSQEVGNELHRAVSRSSHSTIDRRLHQGEAATVREIIRARRLRNECFDPQRFCDPEWDILLDLFLAKAEGRQVSVSSLCIAAAVPHSTALRHISCLVARKLVERIPNRVDGRVTFVEITESGCSPMRDFLKRLAEGTG